MRAMTKAVFPVAGIGSRFLPATKASPKEMMPIVDKPLIQYAVEEAVAAGITEMIFVTGRNKRAIEDHFDKAYELENELASAASRSCSTSCRESCRASVTCIYIRQSEPLGLGHAVLCAQAGGRRRAVRGDPRRRPDRRRAAGDEADGRGVRARGAARCSACRTCRASRPRRYGIVKRLGSTSGWNRIDGIVEKPEPDAAPSTLGVVGRYVLTPRIFAILERVTPGAGGEIQLTDAIAALLQRGARPRVPVPRHALRLRQRSSATCRRPSRSGCKHPEVGGAFGDWLAGGAP